MMLRTLHKRFWLGSKRALDGLQPFVSFVAPLPVMQALSTRSISLSVLYIALTNLYGQAEKHSGKQYSHCTEEKAITIPNRPFHCILNDLNAVLSKHS